MAAPIVLGITIRANGSAQVTGELDRVRGSINGADSAAQNANRSFAAMARETLGLGSALKGLAAGLSVLAIYQSTKELIRLADTMTLLDSRIKIATASQADYLSSSKELVAISLRTGTSFEANATIFSRINKAMEQVGGTTRNTTALTETLAQSLRISGASAGEAASVIRQMSQALASGVLRGDEFNSLMENSPRLSQALADGMHVSIGALRAMAEAGELTSKRVITAIQSQSSVINEEFAKIPLTVGAAMENINTAFGQYVLEANKGSGATAGLAQSVNDLAKNLTPVLDGIVTLGKIAVAVFATQMAGSIATYVATYIAATREAMAIESAHSAAIVQNTQVNIARAEATIIATASVTAFRAAQVGLSIAEEASVTSRLVLVDTSIAQARATIAATSTMVQSTPIIHLNRQATQDLAIAEQARVGIITELNVLGRQQTAISAQLTIAEEAQAAAEARLTAERIAATFSLTGFIAGLTLAGVAMAALSAATSIFIGLQLATYLNEFVAVQNAGASAANYLIKTMETLNYVTEKAILLSKLDIDGARQLRIEHEASMASHDKTTASIIAANNAIEKGSALTGEMAAALESLKTPQQVYNQSIKDATEASKTLDSEALKLDSTSKKMLITEEQRLAVGVKALEIWRQANAEEQNAKLSAAGKEAAKLQDQYDKLTLSPKDYNKQNAQSFAGSPEEIASVERLSNAILTLQESKKALTEDTKEQNSEAKKSAQAVKSLEDTYSSLTSAMAKSIALQGDATATIAMKYDVESGALSKLEHSQKLYLLQQTAILQNKELETKAHAAAKSELETLTDKYNQLTMSARNYYASTLDKKGIKPADQQPILAQFDKNSAIESSKAKFDESTAAVDAYNKSLTETSSKTADINNSTGTLLNGLSAGVNVMTAAFDNFTAKLKDNITATVALNTAKGANDTAIIELDRQKSLNVGLDTYDKKISALNKNKQLYALQEKSNTIAETKNQLNFVGQVANATAQMFKENTTARKAFSLVALAASIAERLQDIAGLTVAGAKATLNQGNGDPYSAFARMAAMAAAVGSILASVAGAGQSGSFNFAGGGKSVSAATPSPDTGTVLGDPTAQSESIDKTYDLLKSIHADEYSELRGINSGVAALSGSITNVITRLFQAGGLSATFTLPPTMITGFAAMNLFPSLAAKIFGGKQTSSIIGQGLSTNATSLNSVMSGGDIGARQYANIETKTSGGWFGSDKYKNSVQYQAVDAATQDAMNDMFKSMGVTMTGLADALGGDLAARVRDYIIPAFTVELKGLSGEDAAKKLNGVISTALDTMSTAVFGDIIGQYQKLGEGMLETAVRIVSEVAVVKDALAKSGLSIASNAIAISDALAQAAGGLAEFQKQFEAYFDKFYTDSEKQAAGYKSLTSSMLDVLYVLPKTREEYRKYIESLNLSNVLDQQRYSMMLKLSDAADSYYTALDAQTKVYTDAISTAKSNLAAAYKTESDAISGTITKLITFIASLKTLKDSLALGNLSTGTPLDKYNESRSQLNSASSIIQAGTGTTTASKAAYDSAVGGINAKITGFLDASKTYNASGSGYTADYQQIMTLIDGLGISAGSQQTDAEKQLEQLTKSVDGLMIVNASVLSVKDALAGVTSAIVSLQTMQTERDKADAVAKAAVAQAAVDRANADVAAVVLASKVSAYNVAAAVAGTANTGAVYSATSGGYFKDPASHLSAYANSWSTELSNALGAFDPAVSVAGWNTVAQQLKDYLYGFNVPQMRGQNPSAASQSAYYANIKNTINGSHANGLDFVPFDGYKAELHRGERVLTANQARSSDHSQEIILELRAIWEEVARLRSDQRDSTGALIQSNYDANDQAAEKVVAGTKDTAKQSAWANESKAVIA